MRHGPFALADGDPEAVAFHLRPRPCGAVRPARTRSGHRRGAIEEMASAAMIMETFNNNLFAGKTALITGAASGIGAGVARCFAKLGAKVLLQDINAEGLAAMVEELGAATGGVTALEGDLSRPGAADAAFDAAL